MAVRRGSTRLAAWLVMLPVMVMAASGGAQQTRPRPPGPESPVTPSLPTAPQPRELVPAQGQPGRITPSFPQTPAPTATPEPPKRAKYQIDPKTPVKDLLPTAPKAPAVAGPLLTDDLAKVPEAAFEAWPARITTDGKIAEQMAHQHAKINHLNAKKTDAFLAALLENRQDLAGLPFVMGDGCRTSGERTKQFTLAVNTIRASLTGSKKKDGDAPSTDPVAEAKAFWERFEKVCEKQDMARMRDPQAPAEHAAVARIGALMQILAAESPELRLGMVRYFTSVPHAEAARALARLAIFSAEEQVRLAAIDALAAHLEADYTDILRQGLRYPYPAVAKRTAEAIVAIVRTGRTDHIPELVALLDEGDPRMPVTKEVGGKTVAVVREMVKVNHHRNCMMCHAPGSAESVAAGALTVDPPVPGQPFPPSRGSYRQSSLSSGLAVRVDVTYLRQDFSVLMAVADAKPWPEMQRFDFLVRERTITADEAKLYREKLTPKEGVFSPYHRAALSALREITGAGNAPTAEAWRELLKLPAKPAGVKTSGGDKPRE
jgi:hypothetical protein